MACALLTPRKGLVDDASLSPSLGFVQFSASFSPSLGLVQFSDLCLTQSKVRFSAVQLVILHSVHI